MTIEKKIRLLSIAVLVLIATNVATIATIFFHPFPFDDDGERFARKEMHQRFIEAGFTKEQMDALKQIRMQYREEGRETMKKARNIRHALHQQLLSDSPDTVEIARLIDEMGANYQSMKRLASKQFLEIKPHCTKEQLHMLLKGDEQMNQGMGRGRNGRGQRNHQEEEPQTNK